MINTIVAPPFPVLNAKAVTQGECLYQPSCAACHMPDLSGAPDWKKPLPYGSLSPPPHEDSGHTWHHPDFLLLQIVAEDGAMYDGVMPGFGEQLSQEEMHAILEFLKSRWSRKSHEYQWWFTNTYPTPTPCIRFAFFSPMITPSSGRVFASFSNALRIQQVFYSTFVSTGNASATEKWGI